MCADHLTVRVYIQLESAALVEVGTITGETLDELAMWSRECFTQMGVQLETLLREKAGDSDELPPSD